MARKTDYVKSDIVVSSIQDPNVTADAFSMYFRNVELSEEKRRMVTEAIVKHVRDWYDNTSELRASALKWLDQSEGITTTKDFPWPGCSNLFIPITEIHLNNMHAQARQVMFRDANLWYVKSVGIDPERQSSAPKIERFLNYVSAVEVPLVKTFSDLTWAAGRDGLAFAQCSWLREYGKKKEVLEFEDIVQFQEKFPSPEVLNIGVEDYAKILAKFSAGKKVFLTVYETYVKYDAPVVNVIELGNAVFSPVNSPSAQYAKLLGKRFILREEHLKAYAKFGVYYKDIVDDILKTGETLGSDQYADHDAKKYALAGITESVEPGQFAFIDGLFRCDLDDDGIEETYIFALHVQSEQLCMFVESPYTRDPIVPVYCKARPNTIIGRGICQMLEDINAEINTQHNQRIDTRTITTVPTFKAKASLLNEFDPRRSDMRFIPGRVFYLSDPGAVEQFTLNKTDLGESLSEESNLFQIADQLTGSTQLRSGQETKADPRAPALKVMQLLAQSNIRLDDYFAEMSGDTKTNTGFAAIGAFLIEAYGKFGKERVEFPILEADGTVKPSEDGTIASETLIKNQLSIDDLKISLQKTNSAQTAEAGFIKWMQLFSILVNEPLVGGRPEARAELIRELLINARAENFERFLPPDINQLSQDMAMNGVNGQLGNMMALSGGQLPSDLGGTGGANANQGEQAGTMPAIPGSTRPAA